MSWFLYVLECRGGSLYTGITNDVAARYAAHAAGQGARYTRAYPPQQLLLTLPYPDRSAASKAEYALKQLSARQKHDYVRACLSVQAAQARSGTATPAAAPRDTPARPAMKQAAVKPLAARAATQKPGTQKAVAKKPAAQKAGTKKAAAKKAGARKTVAKMTLKEAVAQMRVPSSRRPTPRKGR